MDLFLQTESERSPKFHFRLLLQVFHKKKSQGIYTLKLFPNWDSRLSIVKVLPAKSLLTYRNIPSLEGFLPPQVRVRTTDTVVTSVVNNKTDRSQIREKNKSPQGYTRFPLGVISLTTPSTRQKVEGLSTTGRILNLLPLVDEGNF